MKIYYYFFILFYKEILKPVSITAVEQQRERERQRLREEDERRKRLLLKKDHHALLPITSVPKFEQLLFDTHHDDANKTKVEPPPGIFSFYSSQLKSILHSLST